MNEVLLKDFQPSCLLKVAENIPQRARFPVIDAHNHLFGDLSGEELIETMDVVGVQTWVNVTGNTTLLLEGTTYSIVRRDLNYFMEHYVRRWPGRFAALTMADFGQWGNPVLLKNNDFVRHQDRILFGLDMPVSAEAYRCYFRFLETRDEYFDCPDYIGRFGVYSRWKLCGLGLPDEVLEKVYYRNASRVIMGV